MLKLKIKGCLDNCNTLTIEDVTGMYDATDNPEGYGTPNLATSDIDTATLKIESLTDGVPYTYSEDVTDDIKNETDFPVLLDAVLYNFKDGRYCITYTVTMDDGSVYTAVHKLYVYCNVECCVNNYSVKLPELLCDICNKEKIIGKLNTMQVLLKSLRASEFAGNDCAFENILDRLNRICGSDKGYFVKPCSC